MLKFPQGRGRELIAGAEQTLARQRFGEARRARADQVGVGKDLSLEG